MRENTFIKVETSNEGRKIFLVQMSLHVQCGKPVIKLRTTEAGVDGTPNSLTGAGQETISPAGDLMKAVLFFPVSQTETGLRFSVRAFVQPSGGARLTGNRVELHIFPREPFTISVSESWA